MSTLEEQKIWMVLDHPMELATALTMASYWGREKFALNLLISRHPYWRKVDMNLYQDQFDEIIFLDRPEYVPNPIPNPGKILGILRQRKKLAQLEGQSANIAISRSLLRPLLMSLLYPLHILGMILMILRVKKRIAQLGIQHNDIIIGFSITTYVENIVLSMCPKNLKFAVMIEETYQRCTRPINKKTHKNCLEGWLANWLVEPVAGLHRTYCVKDRLRPESYYWWIRYRESLSEIYDKVVVLGDFPNQIGDNIITMPFPYVLAYEKVTDNQLNEKPQKVVFFGSDFMLLAGTIAPEIYAQNLNACLSFLREKYGPTCKLVYRPHPRESIERRLLDLDQFEIEHDGMLAELYFCKNLENIDAVFSVESTSSGSAFHFFINAYSFLDVFPYGERIKSNFKRVTGNVPDDFYINDLSATPNRYVNVEDINEAMKKCRTVLDTVVRE